ncbi:MAG: TetR/AcrR family transcriptional regulator [Saprospiraceae bacterium]|nr:TetR/AcrR family transcriptional regulator [Saprospiraceae bacterium]
MDNQLQQILEQAEKLFLRLGIRSVTMDDISQSMGMSKKTLYQYVDNKADLISKIVLNHVGKETECISKISSDANNAIQEMMEITKYSVQQLREISPVVIFELQKYYRESWEKMEALHKEHVYKVIYENIEKGKKEGFYREEINTDIVSKLYVGKTYLLVDENVFPLKEYDRRKLLIEFFKYHINGLLTDKGRKFLQEILNQN